MIITIGGPAGSGTTTAAKVLSEKLDIPFLSTGFIFRDMAKEYGMTPIEFSKFAENNTDIDKEIDKRQADIAYESGNIIVEDCYFIQNIAGYEGGAIGNSKTTVIRSHHDNTGYHTY